MLNHDSQCSVSLRDAFVCQALPSQRLILCSRLYVVLALVSGYTLGESSEGDSDLIGHIDRHA